MAAWVNLAAMTHFKTSEVSLVAIHIETYEHDSVQP